MEGRYERQATESATGLLDELACVFLEKLVERLEQRTDLTDRVLSLFEERLRANEPERTHLNKDYAHRRSVSKRTVEYWIDAGLPMFGKGRNRRVIVVEADAWLDARHDDGVTQLAKRNARKAAGGEP